jgi:membrane-associated protease RseP (regulator of RpoE activity)
MNALVRVVLAVAASVALIATQVAAQTSAKARELIAAAKAAMGGAAWDSLVTWRESDRVSGGGLTGVATSVGDLRVLRNRGVFTLGPVSGGGGWDGKQAWTIDSSGAVRIETSAESIAGNIQDAYRGASAYLFEGRYPAARQYAGTRQADGHVYEAVKVTPKGAEPFEVWFDPATHLVAREVQLTGVQPQTFIYSDYRRYGPILAPARSIERTGADPRYDIVSEVDMISFAGPESASAYGPPVSSDTAVWPAGANFVTVPFRLIDNHIYVDASINGARPLPFIFDTGAVDFIKTPLAKAMGVKVEGALPGGGFGAELAEVGLARVKSVSVGGLTLADQVFATDSGAGGTPFDGAPSFGLLGYEFARSAVLTIDYQYRTLTFTKAAAFQPPKGAAPIALTFTGQAPVVAGALDGVRGQFEIDTGSHGALTLMGPFARANGLAAKYHATREAVIGYGFGGASKALLARGGKLVLGPVTVQAPLIAISTDEGGVAQMTRTAGNIGGEILKRFTLTLDYARQRAWLAPNDLAGAPEVFDRSGLSFGHLPGGALGIAGVTAGSAAAQAGLAAGEEIVSVDGAPARALALYDLIERLRGPVGSKFTLVVRGRAGVRTVTLVLADQV